jgi:transcriptional regulator GlxA family with amidase domain
VPPDPGIAFAGIRFRPGKAPAFLGAAASALLDSRIALADLWGQAASERLAGQLDAAASPEGAARVLDCAVAQRARTASVSDPIVDGLVGLLQAEPESQGAVRNACRAMFVGERRMYQHCRAAVGYGPKTLDRVLRFQRAIRLGTGCESLALLAARTGYADQAHLTREFNRLAGTTPSDLFKTARSAAS